MARLFVRALAASVLALLILDTAGFGQPSGTPTRIYYRDRKENNAQKSVEGELKTSATGFQVVNAGKVLTVLSPADIIRVVPGDLPGVDRKDVLAQVSLEEKGEWVKARAGYESMKTKSPNLSEKGRQYLEFKTALSAAHAADEDANETGQGKAAEAVKLLDQYLAAYKTGWELWPVAQTCARLQLSLTETKKDGEKETQRRQFEEASRTWGKVARNMDVPVELRQEATVQEVSQLVRARRFGAAASQAAEAEKAAPAGATKERLKIVALAAKAGDSPNPLSAVPAIEAEINKSKDPAVRATGYGMIGELYLAADKPRDAMWAFLWVETVYNQDRDEVVAALVRLSDCFRLQGDEERTKSYQEKVRHYRAGV